jgi:hypothetical protein
MKKIKEKEKIEGKEEARGETEMSDPFRREEEEKKNLDWEMKNKKE